MTRDSKPKSFLVATVLAILALADGVYLSILHVRTMVGESTDGGLCHALSETGCEIALSESGLLFGVPIAMIGTAGALATFVFALGAYVGRRQEHDPLRATLWLVSLASVLASLLMARVSLIDGRFCPFCVLWYVLNMGLLLASWRGLGMPALKGFSAGIRGVFCPVGLVGVALFLVSLGGMHWGYTTLEAEAQARHAEMMAKVIEELKAMTPQEVPPLPNAPTKRFGDGEVQVRFVEFSDLECPFCRKLWNNVEAFAAETEVTIEVQFVHFPLNKMCNPNMRSELHENACDAAKAALCAQDQGVFWEFSDVAFRNQRDLAREDLLEYASGLVGDLETFESCLDSEESRARLAADVAFAAEQGVKATPTMRVNGYKVSGALSPEILHSLVTALLSDI